MLAGMPTSTTTPPAVALDDYRRATRDISTLCPPDRAAAALHQVLIRRGPGSVDELATVMGKSRQTIRYWRQQRHDMDPELVWKIAGYYAADPAPTTADELDALGTVEGQDVVFNLFYSDNDLAAATWLLTHRSGSFRWGNDVAA